jgi:RNA polymerase sigma factor for flagellar operon FliA
LLQSPLILAIILASIILKPHMPPEMPQQEPLMERQPVSRKNEFTPKEREGLVLGNLRQVDLIARRIKDRLPESVLLDDLKSAGTIGLINAVDNYDPSLGVQLNTYAEQKIRGAILDSLRDVDTASREARKKQKSLEIAENDLINKLGRPPDSEDLARYFGKSIGEYHAFQTGAAPENQFVSLDTSPSVEKKLPKGHTPESQLLDEEGKKVFIRSLRSFPSGDQKRVLEAYYLGDKTYREIAQELGVNLSRVGQIRQAGLKRLNEILKRQGYGNEAFPN